MAIVQASGLTKFIGDRQLLQEVSFRLEGGGRMALSGRNGSGKTTLLRVLAGEASVDSGRVSLAKGARVVLHDQRPPRELGLTLGDYVVGGLRWVLEIERRLAQLEERMATDSGEATLAAYSDAQARFESAGGYRWRDEARATVRGLGFGMEELDRDLATFSGGELTRASLARALAAKPDLLLLDEPTNHLDIASLEWLERTLIGMNAAVILVAHDRWFLEAVGNSVLELGEGRPKFFKGPWHEWRSEKLRRELFLERDAKRREADIARLERFVERFRAKSTLATRAKSKQKQINRIKEDAPERDGSASKSLAFSFGEAQRSGKVVLAMEGATIDAGPKRLFEDAELSVEAGEHVCLIGRNGSGKSTLISALVGQSELLSGRVKVGHNVDLGHLRQHAAVPSDPGLTVLSHAQRSTGLSEAKTRALLGKFLFSGDDVMKFVSQLSGGEMQRLGLAILVSSQSNVLILDEPTNHLDLESREALEDALGRFGGTLVLVSHDRAMLEAIGTRTVAVEGKKLRVFLGGWTEYREREAERDAADAAGNTKAAGPIDTERGPDARRARAQARAAVADVRKLENEIERAETALRKLEEELADPAAWSDPRRSERSTRRHETAKRILRDLNKRWEAALEEA
ncbi:MAG: ABC-F family ATP-binding cassette domain-containing protein [Actinomycetota bacterium]|nr:ABC-F family ATP-binding cassette domain-containing protein [Actinomycetota bacterium]